MKRVTPIRDWREMTALNPRGTIDPHSRANLLLVLTEHPVLKNAFGWNDLRTQVELLRDVPGVGKAGDSIDLGRGQLLMVWLERNEGLRANGPDLDRTLFVLAKENPRNCLTASLLALHWDGKPRLATWLATYLGAAGSPVRLESAGTRLLLTAIARVFEPGCGIDAFWFLQAPDPEPIHQALDILFAPYYSRFVDALAFEAQCSAECLGRWCMNMLEGDLWPVRLGQRTKTLARRLTDIAPAHLLRYLTRLPRTCIFVAVVSRFPDAAWLKQVNGTEPFFECLALGDLSGNLRRDRDQLLAEAVALYQSGRSWLHGAWREPEKPHPLRGQVLAYCRDKSEVSMREVVEALGKRYDPTNRGANKEMGIILASLGMRRVNVSAFGTPSSYRYRWIK